MKEGWRRREGGGVEEGKQQSHRVWTFNSVTSGIHFPPGAELGAGPHDFGGGLHFELAVAKSDVTFETKLKCPSPRQEHGDMRI